MTSKPWGRRIRSELEPLKDSSSSELGEGGDGRARMSDVGRGRWQGVDVVSPTPPTTGNPTGRPPQLPKRATGERGRDAFLHESSGAPNTPKVFLVAGGGKHPNALLAQVTSRATIIWERSREPRSRHSFYLPTHAPQSPAGMPNTKIPSEILDKMH